jgi:hypothetical protein
VPFLNPYRLRDVGRPYQATIEPDGFVVFRSFYRTQRVRIEDIAEIWRVPRDNGPVWEFRFTIRHGDRVIEAKTSMVGIKGWETTVLLLELNPKIEAVDI